MTRPARLTVSELAQVVAGLNNPNAFDVGLVGRVTGKRPQPEATQDGE